jgi:ribosomal-protein-alanine N-acetyltransferase
MASMSIAPVMESERLFLRPLLPSDADSFLQVLGDPVAMQHYHAPFTRAEVEAWIERNRIAYAHDGHALWAVALKGSGEVIGACGLLKQDLDGVQEIEIAYHIRRDQWRNGYATEAALACVLYAFKFLRAQRVVSLIPAENMAARRVAEKIGMGVEKRIPWHGLEHMVYSMHTG